MKKGIAILAASFLSACATPHVVKEKKISYEDLGCDALASHIASLEVVEAIARDGFTDTDLHAFFSNSVKKKQKYLMEIREKKDC